MSLATASPLRWRYEIPLRVVHHQGCTLYLKVVNIKTIFRLAALKSYCMPKSYLSSFYWRHILLEVDQQKSNYSFLLYLKFVVKVVGSIAFYRRLFLFLLFVFVSREILYGKNSKPYLIVSNAETKASRYSAN